MSRSRAALLRAAELGLFGFALSLAVPPVPSEPGAGPSHLPALALGGGAFLGSQALTWARKAESPLTATLKTVLYLALVEGIRLRLGLR